MKQKTTSTFRLRILVVLAGVLLGSSGLGNAGGTSSSGHALGPSPVADLKNGWYIFMHGITAQNRTVQNSHGMEGVGCAMCHGEDGRGGSMHGLFAPNITFSFLSNPLGYQDPRGRKRPAYNEESVKAAIVAGIDARGSTLDPEMPRWTGLSATDLEDLIGYLKTLSRPRQEDQSGSEGI
jgi:mono/diheme cytochrome c family protein